MTTKELSRCGQTGLAVTIMLGSAVFLRAQAPGAGPDSSDPASRLGVVIQRPDAFPGYTLVFPLQSTQTFLIDLQETVDSKLDRLLTAEQQKELQELQSGRGFGGGAPQPGQIMSPFVQARLELSEAQKGQLNALPQQVDAKLAAQLDDQQKQRFAQLRSLAGGGGPPRFGRGAPGPGGPDAGPPGFRGRGGGPRRGRGDFPGSPFGQTGGGMFRAYRYALDYPGLAGKDLTPGKTLEAMSQEEER